MSNIGQRICTKRKELGLSQEELAHKMGYKSKSTINKIELGINDVSQTKVVQFAKVLNTSIAYLMGWEEMQKNNDTITDIIVRLRTDIEFLSLVEKVSRLDSERLIAFDKMLDAFNK